MRASSLLLLCILWSMLVFPNNVAADWFGPSNYSACILTNVDPSAPGAVAKLVIQSCKNRFPNIEDTSGRLGMFGPSDFDECVFEYASSVRHANVAKLIYESCRTLFPSKPIAESTSPDRRGILLHAAEVAGKYMAAAITLYEVRTSDCRGIVSQNNMPDAQAVVKEVLAEFPNSEKPKVQSGLEKMYQNLPSPYAKFGGLDAYIGQLVAAMSKDAACGVVWGEVSSMMGNAESEWAAARIQLRKLVSEETDGEATAYSGQDTGLTEEVARQVKEGFDFAGGAKAAVTEFMLDTNRTPESNAEVGLSEAKSIQGEYVGSVTVVVNGIIIVTFASRNDVYEKIRGKFLILTPEHNNGTVYWSCSSPSIDAEYLPAACR